MCGIIIALAGPVPETDGDIAAFSTGLPFQAATAFRNLLTELLDDVPDPTTGTDLEP